MVARGPAKREPVAILIRNRRAAPRLATRRMRILLQTICAALGFEPQAFVLSLSCVGDRSMRALNRRWRQRDRTTDVLSFPQQRLPAAPGGPPRVLGDLVISMPVAARQAFELGHSLEVEVQHLLIHGLLHLLGHRHEAGGAAARRMAAAERRLQRQLGLRPAGLLAAPR